MARITDRPPSDIASELAELQHRLDLVIPQKALDRNLLIGTWNIRAFGDLTEKWRAEVGDTPKRDLHALRCIVEIISRFDVIALQEVKANMKCLRHALKVLGDDWSMVLTDVTRGAAGNGERMGFLFDTRKVRMSGLAAELVVPQEQLTRIAPDALQRQFARTPYAVSFRCGGKTFILVTLHVIYGKNARERVPEVKAIAEWFGGWAQEINTWGHNLIVLGDFNIDRQHDPLYMAFTSTGLTVPPDLLNLPRTIFGDPTRPNLNKFYDQIAWFTRQTGDVPALSLDYVRGGSFDFVDVTLRSLNLTRQALSWRISDHYPLWVEFATRD